MVSLLLISRLDDGATDGGSAIAEEDVVERDGVFDVAGFAALRADLEQDGRLDGARVDEQTGEDDAVGVGSGEGGGAVDGSAAWRSQGP